MKIQIDGAETINKGGELMFYAVLRELSKRQISCNVFVNTNEDWDLSTVQTTLPLKCRTVLRSPLLRKLHLAGLCRRIFQLPPCFYRFLTCYYVPAEINTIFDVSGFHYADAWISTKSSWELHRDYLHQIKKQGVKYILLPQAFGPFENQYSKKTMQLVSESASLIIARDTTSKQYLTDLGVDLSKVLLYPDFTQAAEPVIPKRFQNLVENKVGIIPNMRIVDKGNITKEKYVSQLGDIIRCIRKNNIDVFLLNNESQKDLYLCRCIAENFDNTIPVITNLNALEAKGVISLAYAIISSRYHGVVNALNNAVPCLATSWSHKYELLFKDYSQTNCVLDTNSSSEEICNIINHFLDPSVNRQKRDELKIAYQNVNNLNQEMWNIIWKTLKQ